MRVNHPNRVNGAERWATGVLRHAHRLRPPVYEWSRLRNLYGSARSLTLSESRSRDDPEPLLSKSRGRGSQVMAVTASAHRWRARRAGRLARPQPGGRPREQSGAMVVVRWMAAAARAA